jgi:hypothetical protein
LGVSLGRERPVVKSVLREEWSVMSDE